MLKGLVPFYINYAYNAYIFFCYITTFLLVLIFIPTTQALAEAPWLA